MTLSSIFEQVAGKPVEDRTYNKHAKSLSSESLESLIRNKNKAFVKHNDEIADIFKKELESRNGGKDSAPRVLTGDCKVRIRK